MINLSDFRQSVFILMALFAFGTAMPQNDSASAENTFVAKDELNSIYDLFKNGQGEAASLKLRENEDALIVFAESSSDPRDFLLLGRAYFYAEDDSKAFAAFSSAIERDPNLEEAHFFQGLLHRYTNEFDKSEASLRKAMELDSENIDYMLELALTLELQGDMASASNVYQSVLAVDESNFDAHFNLGNIYAEDKGLEKAEQHFQAAIKAQPEDIDSVYNLGQLYQNHKKYAAALTQFERVVELKPNEWQAVQKLVQLYAANDKLEARDESVDKIYALWREGSLDELIDQGLYIREQIDFGKDKIFVLEYFELKGERPKKYLFTLQDHVTKDFKFDVSLGSYDGTTEFSRAQGTIGPDQRLYHMDGYSPDGSHYTYQFFEFEPAYDVVKEIAMKVFNAELDAISGTKIIKQSD